jgi:hypothetical protein
MPPPIEPPAPKQPAEVLQDVAGLIDEARGHLERAEAALATATFYANLAVAREAESHPDQPPE